MVENQISRIKIEEKPPEEENKKENETRENSEGQSTESSVPGSVSTSKQNYEDNTKTVHRSKTNSSHNNVIHRNKLLHNTQFTRNS